jgi:hypothetical protein
MRAVWKLFHELPELAYIFGVRCDSHGQQLVIKDIVDPRVINKVKILLEIYDFWLDLQSIIKQFSKKNTLQLSIFRQKQFDSCGKTFALIVAGNT